MAALYTIGAFAVIFDQDGDVLLCHRRDMDMWNLPGGGLESGELPPEAVIREVKEETGLDVTVRQLVGVYGKPQPDDIVFTFICDVTGGQLTETNESDDCRYFALEAIPVNMIPKQVARIYDAASATGQPVFRKQRGPASREWLPIQSRYGEPLQKIFELREQIKGLHPLLTQVFPIAIVEDNQFLIFDVDPSGKRYTFVEKAPTPMPVPWGVRAAFPLECYENKAACVVTGEVFDTLDGYATIFHEFVHCYQMDTCENTLKATLSVAQKAQTANDFMWEINYPFPYDAPDFVMTYSTFLEATAHYQYDAIRECRARLRQDLQAEDFEYMVWQEWKEGFARFIENRIRQRLGLAENHGGATPPFDRVTFYEGGARLIATQPEMTIDIRRLYNFISRFSR